MGSLPFREIEKKLREMLALGEYSKIIDMIDQVIAQYPEEQLYLVYWQIGMAARLGKPKLVYALLDDLLGKGLWISPDLLRQSPSLENLQELAEYNERVDACQKLQQEEYRQMVPLLLLRQQGERSAPARPAPLLIGLHDDRQQATDAALFWGSAGHKGWLVGVPQSSQALWSRAYVWDNRQLAQEEIEHALESIRNTYPVDPRRVVVAGLGVGGEMAAWLLAAGGIEARGFIMVNPDGPMMRDPDHWMKLLQSRPRTHYGAVLLDSTHPTPDLVERTVEIFNIFGSHVHLEYLDNPVNPHDGDYLRAFLGALDFVMT